MCDINNTDPTSVFLATTVKEQEDYDSYGLSDNSDVATSVLVTYLRALLLSSALPGVLTLLSWLLWLMYYATFRSNASQLPLPPGSMGLPLIGETITLFLLGATFYKKRRKLYGDVFKTHLMGRPIVRVAGASNVRKVLMGENTLVTSFWPASVRLMLGTNTISMSTGDRHKFLRKGVSKAFNHDALSSHVSVMQQMTRDAIQRWCDAAYVRGYRECQTLTFSIACRALLGLGHSSTATHSNLGAAKAEIDKFLDVFETWTHNLFSLPINLPGCGLSRGLRARKVLLDKVEEIIRSKEREEITTSDALSLMMRLGGDEGKLSMEELKEVCLELLFAGHATVASASTSLLYFLGRNPRVVKRIQRELEDHGLKDANQNGDLTCHALSRLTYVDHVVKEALRLAPPVGAGFRVALKTFEVDGYQVPKDWTVVYSIRETQAFSELFTDSDRFEPERWETIGQSADDEKEDFHFLPFSRGARGCVGKEYAKLLLKIFVVETCRTCHWRLLNEDVELKMIPVPQPADGLPLHVTHLLPGHVRPRAATV